MIPLKPPLTKHPKIRIEASRVPEGGTIKREITAKGREATLILNAARR
jgi:hypothetical protein